MSTKSPKNVAAVAAETAQTAARNAKAAGEEFATSVDSAFGSFREKLEVPAAARDFVQRAAASAKERLADAHAGANNATVSYEKAMSTFVNAGATALRSLLQAGYDNSLATLAAFEKLAAAKSVQEAYRIQSDFAQEYAQANWRRAQNVAETVKANVQDGVKLIQDEAGKVISTTFKKAA